MKKLIVSLMMVTGVGLAQFKQLDLIGFNPTPVTAGLANVVGQSGNTTYCYWIIARYPAGNAIPYYPIIISTAPDTLSGSNYVKLSWPSMVGVTGWDVLRTNSITLPSGTNSIALATGLTAATLSYSNVNSTFSSYTVQGTPSVVGTEILDAVNYPSPRYVFDYPIQAPGITTTDGTYNVKTYGAVGDGTTDDTVAIKAALTAAGSGGYVKAGNTVFFPVGTYRITSTITLSGNKLQLLGMGYGSQIIGDLAVTPMVQVGTGSVTCFDCRINNLFINRAAGTIPSGVVGVYARAYNYLNIVDVGISRHAKCLATDGSSLGLKLTKTLMWETIDRYVELKDALETTITDSDFGRNGGETNAPLYQLVITGAITDTVNIINTTFIPRVVNTSKVFAWLGFTGTNGSVWLNHVNLENAATAFYSDGSTTGVNELYVTGSRITGSASLFAFNAVTTINNLNFTSNSVGGFSSSSLGNVFKSHIASNFFGIPTTWAGGDGNNFAASSTFSGAFTALTVIGNNLTFNNSAPVTFSFSGATGNLNVWGNTADGSTQPPMFISGVPVYADNAAALTGGLVVGNMYKTSTGQLMIVY